MSNNMPEVICEDCGKRLFHENVDTLKIEESVHKKFCRKKGGGTHSFMHKDGEHMDPMDLERTKDEDEKPILKR